MSTATTDAARIVDGREVPVAGTWVIDPAHSTVEGVVRHLMVSKVRGRFDRFSGTIEVAERLEDSSVDFEIDAASINTNQEERDAHLRSSDFLDVDRFPTITFRSRDIEASGDHWRVTGDLTIRDVTREVVLDVTFGGVLPDPFGATKAMCSASTTINREDFGITWNQSLETGGVLVGKEIDAELEIQAALQS